MLGHSEKKARNDEMKTLNLLSSTMMIMLPIFCVGRVFTGLRLNCDEFFNT